MVYGRGCVIPTAIGNVPIFILQRVVGQSLYNCVHGVNNKLFVSIFQPYIHVIIISMEM